MLDFLRSPRKLHHVLGISVPEPLASRVVLLSWRVAIFPPLVFATTDHYAPVQGHIPHRVMAGSGLRERLSQRRSTLTQGTGPYAGGADAN